MGSRILRTKRFITFASMLAMFALVVACGSDDGTPAASSPDTAPATEATPRPTLPPATVANDPPELIDSISPEPMAIAPRREPTGSNIEEVSDTPIPAPDPTATEKPSQEAAAEPTEPPLINTPSPVMNLAPDFTLPSVQGDEYTLSQFRGDKPVAVVFYRAYW